MTFTDISIFMTVMLCSVCECIHRQLYAQRHNPIALTELSHLVIGKTQKNLVLMFYSGALYFAVIVLAFIHFRVWVAFVVWIGAQLVGGIFLGLLGFYRWKLVPFLLYYASVLALGFYYIEFRARNA